MEEVTPTNTAASNIKKDFRLDTAGKSVKISGRD